MEDLKQFANTLLARAKQADVTVIVAESCTAGLMSQVLADAEGASQYFHGGFVTYTKEQKTRALGVSASVLREQGAVNAEVARAMAEGALARSSAGIGAAITGVAGPDPDQDGNPVGRICIAVAVRGQPAGCFERNYGNAGREAIRRRAVADALNAMTEALASVSAHEPA